MNDTLIDEQVEGQMELDDATVYRVVYSSVHAELCPGLDEQTFGTLRDALEAMPDELQSNLGPDRPLGFRIVEEGPKFKRAWGSSTQCGPDGIPGVIWTAGAWVLLRADDPT